MVYCKIFQKNILKCDIVDTNLHTSCTPGTIQTNNTASLLYGSRLNKQMSGMHKKANRHIFKSFDLMYDVFYAGECMKFIPYETKLMSTKARVLGSLEVYFT